MVVEVVAEAEVDGPIHSKRRTQIAWVWWNDRKCSDSQVSLQKIWGRYLLLFCSSIESLNLRRWFFFPLPLSFGK